MRTLETTVVPGLLQTPEYARAVTRAAVDGMPAERLDTLVEVRLARQDVLRGEPPLELSAVLDEAVLRREVGGPVMARQLARLVEAARLPHVRLQVLPFAAGAHIGVTGPFVIFSFSSTSDLDVVVLDHLTSSLHLERKEDLEAYTGSFNALLIHALSPRTRWTSSPRPRQARKEAPCQAPCPNVPGNIPVSTDMTGVRAGGAAVTAPARTTVWRRPVRRPVPGPGCSPCATPRTRPAPALLFSPGSWTAFTAGVHRD
ncbi:hypothetical protein STENM327S_00414 [Streptomyces tendae]